MVWEGVGRDVRVAMLGAEGRGNMMDDACGGVWVEANCFENEGMKFWWIEDVPVVLNGLSPTVDPGNGRKYRNEEAESCYIGRTVFTHSALREVIADIAFGVEL